MFDRVAGHYDLLNDLLSWGLDRWWRRTTARAVASPSEPGDWVLDLGCGTGRLGLLLAGRMRVAGVDLSHSMVVAGRRNARRRGERIAFVEGSAFRLPFPAGVFASAVSGFVLRNLDDLPSSFAELHRVLRPGGTAALVDITEPQQRLVRGLFDAYFGIAAPALGSLVGRGDEYRYLVRSLANLPAPGEVCDLLRGAGFDRCHARPLTGGVAMLFTATKPASSPDGS